MDLTDAAQLLKAAHDAAPDAEPLSAPVPALAAADLLALHALALQHERFEPAAGAVLAELATRLGCERISLGWHQGARARLAAMSGGEADARANLTAAIEAAMDEALDERNVVIYPAAPGSAGGLSHAHAELVRQNGGVPACTAPIVSAGRLLGALTLERRTGFDAAMSSAAQDAAQFLGPMLEMMHRLDAPLSGRLAEAMRPRGMRIGRRNWSRWQVVLLALPALLLVAALLPMRHDVVATARLEGAEQHVVAAPADGYVVRALVRPGADVKAGELLVQLDDRDQRLQRERWAAEIAQYDKQYREALTRDEAGATALARTKLEQAQAQFALAERELERTQLTAPIDGVVIGGDLGQSAGMPVQRGQPLLTVAPALQMKVVTEVDEQDIAELRAGQRARVLFAAAGQPTVEFTVTRVSPVAVTLEGRNVFEVEGTLDTASASALRPGQRGVSRIEVGRLSGAELAWRQASHAWRRLTWRLLG